MSRLMRFSECESSVFVSYAHADDELNNRWISQFATELHRDLDAALAREVIGRDEMPRVHLSEVNGPVMGDLGPQLQARVARCFAMAIVIDEQYLGSDWCLQELRYFQQAFGDEGLDSRLYILALRAAPMNAVVARPQWQQLFAGRNPVRRSFFDADALEPRPVPVLRDDGPGMTNAMFSRYKPLLDDLVAKIRADLTVPAAPKAVPRWMIGACTPELQDRVQHFADELGEHEPLVGLVPPEALLRSKDLAALLQGATTLILPFNRGQPINDTVDGGHIAQQVAAWGRLGKRDDSLLLMDLSDIAAAEPAEPQHLKYLDDSPLARLSPAQVLDRLVPKPAGTAPAEPRRPSLPVRVFIESSRNEPDEWKQLGAQIRTRWDKLLRTRGVDAPLSLRTAGFDIDAIDDFPLDEADGLVLLWGAKDRRSLLSQINRVEDIVTAPAPAIVAHLSPPQPRSEQRMPAVQWEVLRFNARNLPPTVLEPDTEDDSHLDAFVQDVLGNTLRRHGVPGAAT